LKGKGIFAGNTRRAAAASLDLAIVKAWDPARKTLFCWFVVSR
jgi:hypothetical protein